ncbi:MAG: T9SS type A sorting domain-containing protein [bacterium]|nr:T9SS type A sorting domain-containing protein [bacterium]
MGCRHIAPAHPRLLAGMLLLLIVLFPALAGANWIDLGDGNPLAVELLEDNSTRSVMEIKVGGFEATEVNIEGQTWFDISLLREGIPLEAGLPELPNVRRSLVIPNDREMAVNILVAEYVDLPNMPVAPSKGSISRSVDPASVPYTFDPFYQSADIWPAEIVTGETPHIIRDLRGMVLDANVFQYLPATRTLRVYTRLVIEVVAVGPGKVNVLHADARLTRVDSQFDKLYSNHFLNYGQSRYTPVQEDGGLLIISYDAFASSMLPLVEWKMQKGIQTKLVTLSETGSSFSQIKSYITAEYNDWAPAYVLLVGDIAQVPIGSDSDPEYSTISGSDTYPELFIGRFSAENPTHVDTQVERTITYERDQEAGADWPQYAMGVASNEGPGHYDEYDDEHEDLIRDDLLGYGYLGVDQFYAPSATSAQISSALNEGRGQANYTGHGGSTSWVTTGFNNTRVNGLTNENKLPFICSVACNNGTFTETCFAEAWLRATNNGVPTGAVAVYMSYISQDWDPPMYGQDEAVDLLTADEMRTVGGLWFNGSCHMMDTSGSSGINEFLNWTIFGDPSLAVRTKAAATMALNHTGALFIGMPSYDVTVSGVPGALCALYADGVLFGTGVTNGSGQATIAMASPPAAPMTLTLTVTAYNKVTVIDEVAVLPPSGPYLVLNEVTVIDGGMGNGLLDAAESVQLAVDLENVGVEEAQGITLTLTSVDPYIDITSNAGACDDVGAGNIGTATPPFELTVSGTTPNGHLAEFTLLISSATADWDCTFSLPVQAPELSVCDSAVNDTTGGNSSGTADAGETFQLQLTLANTGLADAANLVGVVTTSDPNTTILGGSAPCAIVPADGEGAIGYFEIEILSSCPEPTMIEFDLVLTGPVGFTADLEFELAVGGWFDDMEVDRGWTAGTAGDDASSGQWTRVDPNGTSYNSVVVQTEDDHSPAPGTMCFVTGNASAGSSAGTNDVDGGKTTLLSPLFRLDGAVSAQISYWRWFTEDTGNNPNEEYWNVDVTSNGVDWVSLEHTMESATEWLQFTFNLADYVTLTDQVQVRFIAADEGSGTLVEAAVDDFHLLVAYGVQTAVDNPSALPSRLALGGNYPNPFNPTTTITFDMPATGKVDLAIYDVTGRRVATLVQGMVEAGSHEVIWQGRDDRGVSVASGLYFSRLISGGELHTRKMLLLK